MDSSSCWVAVPSGSPFPLHNLPFGIGRRADGTVGAFVAIGDDALDLDDAVGTGFLDDTPIEHGTVDRDRRLNVLFGRGRAAVEAVRARLTELLTDPAVEAQLRPSLCPQRDLEMLVPVRVGDYVDFYSSLHHATNLGMLFRPDSDALLPNWRHIPVGYHGRAGTIVPTNADIVRPSGVRLVDGEPVYGPSLSLDIELEVGAIVGRGTRAGEPVGADAAEDHIAGLCLVNDWSARDIQAFEYQPLGPFLGKSFATSMSPWVVSIDALTPFRVDAPIQEPPVARYLRTTGPSGFDVHLEVLIESETMRLDGIDPTVVSRTRFDDMYWTPAQQLAHIVVNGADVQPGDLFASGTVSGPAPGSEGSLIEMTRGGSRPLDLADGSTRTYLEDGDRVTLRGWAGSDPRTRIGLGSVTGTIVAGRAGEEH
jgi:fumarylacetoacetase